MLTSSSPGAVFSQVMATLPEYSIWLLPVALVENLVQLFLGLQLLSHWETEIQIHLPLR